MNPGYALVAVGCSLILLGSVASIVAGAFLAVVGIIAFGEVKS